jgi:HD-GYP domain-containing protein (c-di-GMP phosphodiesterase class II)
MYTTHELLEKLNDHSPTTFRHSLRVGDELYGFSCYLGLESPEQYFLLGALHDIGKLNIPLSLLNKEGELTHDEFAEIKRHTQYGAEILEQNRTIPSSFANIVYYHHENINGTGYYGIEDKKIPLISKMIRIVDSYDTMLHGRHYQEPIIQWKVIDELVSLADKYYERELVIAFKNYVSKKY